MKSLSKNVLITICARIVTLITGLIVQQRILLAYGSSLNGLTSSISQIMSYLVLLEAGLGTASIQALYSPLSQDNWDQASGIITATGVSYKKISAAFFTLLAGASVLLPLAVAGQVEYVTAGMLTLITGASYVISYILGGKYKALLTADRKLYILEELEIFSTILSCLLRVLALEKGCGIVLVQTLNLLCVLIKNAAYFVYVRAKYKNIDYKHKPNFYAVRKRWNVLIHSLAGLVVNHTDVMILTFFADLKIVSVYSVYNLVFSQLSTLIQSTFITAPQANFGRLYSEDKQRYNKAYGIYETLYLIIIFCITAISLIMVMPFVRIYTAGVTDVNYVDVFLPILFALILLMNLCRVPAILTVNISGCFKETQNGAIIEAIINVVVSIALFFLTPLGLYGLLIGTVCSYVFRTTELILYAYRHLLNRSIVKYIRTFCVNAIVLVFLYFCFCVMLPVEAVSVGEWVMSAIGISILSVVAFLFGNYIFNHFETNMCLSYFKIRIKEVLGK